jgi:rSAM/selenodomain-associated transferase 1
MIQSPDLETSTRRLIVFARCPEPGQCKTRLISALGESGAMAVHETLVRRTMSWMGHSLNDGIEVEIQYAGDDLESLRRLCGEAADRISFRPQRAGDLGDRLAQAFSIAFQEGASKVAIIGTDCPELTHGMIVKAFGALAANDLVLGPAMDGGYYLIASRAHNPELFTNIGWGGSMVLDDTLARARCLSLTAELLEPLSDVDRPEDAELLLGKDLT